MRKRFDELISVDHDMIAQKSHIVQSTLDDVINKRFEKFNPVKAKGIAKTLENDFNIEMSDWLSEYEQFRNHKTESVSTVDRVAIETVQENKIPRKKIATIIGSIIVVLLFAYILITNNPLGSLIGEQNLTDAQYKADINKSEEANATNAALLQNSEQNETLPSAILPIDKNTTKPEENSTKSITETNKTNTIPSISTNHQNSKLVLETPKKLWYKVIYLDNNKSEENTMEPGKLELDGTRTKIIILGHQQNKITFGTTVIESKAGAKIRYLMKDKKLTQISEPEVFKLQGKEVPTSKAQLDSN